MIPEGVCMRLRGYCIPVLLAVLFLFNAAGNIFVIWRLGEEAKRDFRKQLRSGSYSGAVVELRFGINEKVPLIDGGKEILLDGMKYDIISVQEKSCEKVYRCVMDTKETEILKSYVEDNLGKGNSQSPPKRLMTGLILEAMQPVRYFFTPDVREQFFAAVLCRVPLRTDIVIPSPPPEVYPST